MVQKYLYTTLRYNFSFVCIIESYTKFFFQKSFQIDRSKIIQTKLNKNIFDKERKKKQKTWLHRYNKKKKILEQSCLCQNVSVYPLNGRFGVVSSSPPRL